jgi:oxygen-dependent protoporphyrinogen oxidase
VICIIGGGITGLAAAYELTRRQEAFLLFESSPRLGGLIQTEHRDGFVLDAGPDSMLAQKRAAVDLCHEIGLGARLMGTSPPRTAFVLKRGRLHALPSPSVLGIPTSARALARYDLLPWTARARLALEPLVPRRAAGDESVASFFRRRFGAATVGLVAEPLLGGIHAGDVERLSMPALFPRLAEAERRPGKVLLTLRRTRQADPHGAFRALAGGMAELVDRIAAVLPPGSVRLGAAVTGIQSSGRGWRVAAGDAAHDAAAVVIAAPAHAAARLLAPFDAAAAAACGAVPYVSTASVALGWRREDVEHPLQGTGFVVARGHSDARITACTWVSSKWTARAPEGHVLLRAFVGGAHDPAAAGLDDERLVGIATRDLAPVLGIGAPPRLARVFRWPGAGAQHEVGHRARMTGLRERLRAWPGLFVSGSGFDSIGIPDCVADGRAAGAAAADYVRMAG